MRIDKFLKVSRVIKRRTVANNACAGEHVSVNGRVVKASYDVKVGDLVEIKFGDKTLKFKVLEVKEHSGKADASSMYEIKSFACSSVPTIGAISVSILARII